MKNLNYIENLIREDLIAIAQKSLKKSGTEMPSNEIKRDIYLMADVFAECIMQEIYEFIIKRDEKLMDLK